MFTYESPCIYSLNVWITRNHTLTQFFHSWRAWVPHNPLHLDQWPQWFHPCSNQTGSSRTKICLGNPWTLDLGLALSHLDSSHALCPCKSQFVYSLQSSTRERCQGLFMPLLCSTLVIRIPDIKPRIKKWVRQKILNTSLDNCISIVCRSGIILKELSSKKCW